MDEVGLVEVAELGGKSRQAAFIRALVGGKPVGRVLVAKALDRHSIDEEIYVVVAGSGRALVDGEIVDLGPWTVLRVAAAAARAFAAGSEGLEFLAFGTHTEGDRGEFVEASWPNRG